MPSEKYMNRWRYRLEHLQQYKNREKYIWTDAEKDRYEQMLGKIWTDANIDRSINMNICRNWIMGRYEQMLR